MTRYRVVTRTTTAGGTETHVSSVVQSHEEALVDLDIEEQIASGAGWITLRFETNGVLELICHRGKTVRSITIRESEPFNDQIT